MSIAQRNYPSLIRPILKLCIECNENKELSSFCKKAQYPDGLNCYCRECVAKKSKVYYEANKEKRREKRLIANKTYRDSHKEKLKALSRSITSRYSSYKSSAKDRNIPFSLTLEDFEIFWNTQCSYCGEDIDGVGIDRIDSTKGYTLENCVPCCTKDNYMKSSHSEQEWYDRMLLILKNQGII